MNRALRVLKKLRKNPRYIITWLCKKGFFNFLSDRAYVKLQYWAMMKQKLNLNNPISFNEKVQWLLLNDRNPNYSSLVDKYDVKQIVSSRIGEEYVIPTYGIWNTVDEIDLDSLPNQFVLKCTHDSGSVVICKDKSSFDFVAAKRKLHKALNTNFYRFGREWYYKSIKPRIIAEKYMEDFEFGELRDYKFFSFDGVVKIMFIACNRFDSSKETSFDFFDMDFNHLPIKQGHPNADLIPSKPHNFELMKKLAEELSVGIPQVRIDFYEVNKRVYFGEYTFSHFGGSVPFEPCCWDTKLGSWINLPQKDILK